MPWACSAGARHFARSLCQADPAVPWGPWKEGLAQPELQGACCQHRLFSARFPLSPLCPSAGCRLLRFWTSHVAGPCPPGSQNLTATCSRWVGGENQEHLLIKILLERRQPVTKATSLRDQTLHFMFRRKWSCWWPYLTPKGNSCSVYGLEVLVGGGSINPEVRGEGANFSVCL